MALDRESVLMSSSLRLAIRRRFLFLDETRCEDQPGNERVYTAEKRPGSRVEIPSKNDKKGTNHLMSAMIANDGNGNFLPPHAVMSIGSLSDYDLAPAAEAGIEVNTNQSGYLTSDEFWSTLERLLRLEQYRIPLENEQCIWVFLDRASSRFKV